MTKRVFIAAGLAAVLAGGSAVALAQGPQGRIERHGGPGMMRGGPGADFALRGIDLDEAQRDQVRAIRESHKAELEQVRTRLRDAHRAFNEAVQAQTVDEAAIRARSADVAAAMADQAILSAKVRSEVFNILTAEQQQQLAERRAERQKRLQERQNNRQPRRQP